MNGWLKLGFIIASIIFAGGGTIAIGSWERAEHSRRINKLEDVIERIVPDLAAIRADTEWMKRNWPATGTNRR